MIHLLWDALVEEIAFRRWCRRVMVKLHGRYYVQQRYRTQPSAYFGYTITVGTDTGRLRDSMARLHYECRTFPS